MSPDKKLISAVDLSVTFKVPSGSLRAVDTVSFYVNAGETVAIVGESGSGKTTLALSLMRAYAPTSGNLFFEDEDITHLCLYVEMVSLELYQIGSCLVLL